MSDDGLCWVSNRTVQANEPLTLLYFHQIMCEKPPGLLGMEYNKVSLAGNYITKSVDIRQDENSFIKGLRAQGRGS